MMFFLSPPSMCIALGGRTVHTRRMRFCYLPFDSFSVSPSFLTSRCNQDEKVESRRSSQPHLQHLQGQREKNRDARCKSCTFQLTDLLTALKLLPYDVMSIF